MSSTHEGPRDLLGEATAEGFSRDDLADVFTSWLWSQFLEDRWAKLDQARVPESQRTRLAAVFVDVETTDLWGRGTSPFLNRWLTTVRASRLSRSERWERQLRGSDDPSFVWLGRSSRGWGGRMARPVFDRSAEVLVGGPGQGKSTLTQMLAQCHRAAFLRGRGGDVSVERSHALEEFVRDTVDGGLALPEAPLFPVRIDLPRFATWQHTQRNYTLSAFLAEQITRRTGTPVTEHDVGLLLRRLPWIFLFDGLDEVPAGPGRDKLIRGISETLVTLDGSEGAMVVTTRPQGYRNEFGHLAHNRLVPLEHDQIERYAARLAAVRYTDQPEEQETVQARIAEALADAATARLLETPLQVTIMVTLVMQIGQAPSERWRLFTEYYRTVYSRETSKGGELAKLLSTMRQHIDAIHRHVGLLLQVSSEREGRSDATLSTDLLRAVALARLDAEGFAADRARLLADQIVDAAMLRLVFLIEVQQGERLGFEIRSLQEYMAAWALTVGDDAKVLDRVRAIAPHPHWRNTYVFAVGSVFDSATGLRDAVTVDVCRSLGGFAGRDLALDLLEDKTVLARPKVTSELVTFVLSDLSLCPVRAARVMSDGVLHDECGSFRKLNDVILDWFERDDVDPRHAWDQLISLSLVLGPDWVDEEARARWPSDAAEAARLFAVTYLLEWRDDEVDSERHAKLDELFEGAEPWSEFFARVPQPLLDRALAEVDAALDAAAEAPPPPVSPLARYGEWLRLGLPDPAPDVGDAPVLGSDFSPVLRKITVRGVRALQNVEIELPAHDATKGQSVLLLGKNGSGKTTLLRALTFALVDPAITEVALQQSTSRYLNLFGATTVADCVVETGHGVFHTEVSARGGLEVARARSPRGGRRPFVVAYGCRRGSAAAGERDPGATPFDDVGTLFDRPWGLVQCEAWLRNLQSAGNGDLVVFEEVRRVLLRVLPGVEQIFFREGVLRVSGSAVGEVEFAALSDGYLTTAGFVADILYRWKLRASRLGMKLEPHFADTMAGIALIDEIDLHLHPAWQSSVLDDLRSAFPRMTFVGTTHNPLTVAGTRDVIELERTEEGVRATLLRNDARLMTVAQIYRTFFRVADLFPHPLGEKLRRYGLLAGDPTRTDEQDAEARRLLAELVAEGADPGWEPVPRAEASEVSP